MTWVQLHAESERLAIDAQLARRAQNHGLALRLYKDAAEIEQKALSELDASKVRTRGITAVSAVALWFKAEEFARAEQLAHSVLASPDIPEFACEDLRNLIQAIWTESAKQKAGVDFIPGQVLVSVKGGDVITGGAPLDLIVDKVQAIQSLFYRTIEFVNGVAFRRVGRPAKELLDSCRPWLFQSPPGSYQFSVAIQKPVQADFFRQDVEPARIAEHFLEIVSASSNADPAALEALVPDQSYRSTFLKLARNLAPTGKTFERIELSISGEAQPIALDVDSRNNINQQLRYKASNSPTQENTNTPVELRGTLRAVHLDQDWLEMLVGENSVHIEGLQDAVDDVIGPMVNRSVVVRAARVSRKKLKFIDIEMAE